MYQLENYLSGRGRTRLSSVTRGGAGMLVVAALSITTVTSAPDAYARRQRSSAENSNTMQRAGEPIERFSVTTLERMQAFDLANGVGEPTVVQFMPAPPPQVAPFSDETTASRLMPVGTTMPLPGSAGSGIEPSAPPLITSFAGVVDNGTSIPPDTNGAVGPNHVVELINTGFTVFDRSGGVVSAQISHRAFWSVLGTGAGQPANSPFDPRLKYDQYVGRWIVAADARGGWVLVGISQTSDPTGAWNLFAIQGSVNDGVSNHTNDFADFPGLGLDPNNVIITNNMFSNNGFFVHADVWVIDKAKLIAGGTLTQNVDYSLIHNPCGTFGFTFSPAHTFGQTAGTATNYIVDQGWSDNATRKRRFLRVKQITGTGAGAVLNCAGGNDWVEVAPYNLNQLNASQLSCSTTIDSGGTRIRNLVWRNGKLWTTHSVGTGPAVTTSASATRAAIAWYEIDPAVAGTFPGGVPNQQGRVGGGAFAYFDPSIAVNADECVALGFSGSHSGTFIGGFYTGRQSIDPPGSMQSVSVLHSGTNPYLKTFGSGRNRWGDYSATMVDPVDDLTFWTLQEFATLPFGNPITCSTNGGRWATWWGSFQCGPDVFSCEAPSAPVGQTILDGAGIGVPNVKNRYLSFSVANAGLQQAVRVTFVALPGSFSILNGTSVWVDMPQLVVPGSRSFMAATLSTTPVFADWSAFGVVHVFDDRIIPSRQQASQPLEPAIYQIQLVTDGCDVNNPASFSAPLTITNVRWGDIAELSGGDFRAAEGTISVGDTLGLIASFASNAGAPGIPRTDMLGAGSLGPAATVDQVIDVLDLLAVLDAFSGGEYPFSFP